LSPARQNNRRSRAEVDRPHIAEWFGHRVFPDVSSGSEVVSDQRSKRCVFLSETLQEKTACTKQANSRGVCTISANSNGTRQDWLVCPFRALDDDLLADMVRRLYGIPASQPVVIRPVVKLAEDRGRSETLEALNGPYRVFVYFQSKLGGEINLRPTLASPELSFDFTIVELLAAGPDGGLPGLAKAAVSVGRYGVIELQTMDFHGSYKQAVDALVHGLDLHGDHFSEMLSQNPEWAGRKVEGPNIANVFKRTFYQIIFKFQLTSRDTSVGCALALPQPVWDSWQPFLGAPDLHMRSDGTWRLLDDQESEPRDWIYVFDIDSNPRTDGRPAPISISRVIGTDARTLSRAAFDVAPAKAMEQGDGVDSIAANISSKLRAYLPEILS